MISAPHRSLTLRSRAYNHSVAGQRLVKLDAEWPIASPGSLVLSGRLGSTLESPAKWFDAVGSRFVGIFHRQRETEPGE